MKIVMKDYNLESFKEKDIYEFDEIIAIIENLEEELHNYKEKEEEVYEKDDDDEQYDEDRNTLAYDINLGRND